MSVQIVKNETYKNVAGFLANIHHTPGNWEIKSVVARYDVFAEVEKLRQENYKSYEQRYKEPAELPPIRYPYSAELSLIQLIKYLECIQEQIETNTDMTFVESVLAAARKTFIRSLPQYDKALWN